MREETPYTTEYPVNPEQFAGRKKSPLDLAGLKTGLECVLKKRIGLAEYSTVHSLLKDRVLEEV